MIASTIYLQLKLDSEEYDEQQVIFIHPINDVVKSRIDETGISGDCLKRLIGDISSGIATLIENSASNELDGK